MDKENMSKPIIDRKNAQGSITEKGMDHFEITATLILQGLISANLQLEDCAEMREKDPYKGLSGDQFLAKRACELANALLQELKAW
jgi:hypothetical protein